MYLQTTTRRSEQRRVRLRADDNIQLETSVMDKQVLPNFQLSPTAPSDRNGFVACVCIRLLHSSVKCCCCLVRPAKRTNGAIGYCLARFTGRPPGLVGCHVQDCMSEMDVFQALGQEGSRQTRCQFEVASKIEIDLCQQIDQGNIAPDEWHGGIPHRPSGCATKRRYAAVTWLELERLKTRTVALPDPENVKTVTYQVLSEALIAVMSVCFCIPFSSILSRFASSDSKRRRTRHFSE
ncbi:hypothetical protein NEUTE1DRAFT_101514 [Neurospora tetrasperma FGSC 2508]|uniref:Uncharacterized protein n=1 Tax=Neurospora tetrasperma (strain FGSC 2508 / ATCC MYA-4615 / P0657) TaxID=510951 RepID=F8MP18_NEUT8|nr:uncharacterized protein NEUTE1DRAFT_101514 [Neurospora tetrasperma FGSC 2508]EGO56237.1 hypothetical protein NEUTE1DRAFT_101514 [Neurospora tetrasperma FGSC 2508]